MHRDTSVASPSYVTGELISQRLLFVTCMTIFIMVITCGLALLVVEQTGNIFMNMVSSLFYTASRSLLTHRQTTNEKVNRSRYWWMKGPDGRPLNRFDRGPLVNFLEFIGFPCYHVDYSTIMTVPDPATCPDTTNRDTELIAQTGTSPSSLKSEGVTVGGGGTPNPLNHEQCSCPHPEHDHGPSTRF
jgi:hypothetical protein